MNINKLRKYCMHYWVIILLSILIIVLISYCFINKKNIEGFSILEACTDALTEYAYLGVAKDAPMKEYQNGNIITNANYWSQQAYDGVNNQFKKKGLQCSEDKEEASNGCIPYYSSDKLAGMLQMVGTNDEAIYFGQFGVWPYGSYSLKYIDAHKDEGLNNQITELIPARFGYVWSGQFFEDVSFEPGAANDSEVLKIFSGQVEPPPPFETNTLPGIECKIGRTFMTS